MPATGPATSGAVLVTIALESGRAGDRRRIVRALRELIQAGGRESAGLLPTGTPTGVGRRAQPPGGTADGPVEIRSGTRTVLVDGLPAPLSRLEYDLLLFLVRHPNRVFTRQQLLTHVWGHTYAGGRTVDVHVRRLRMKIDVGRPLVTTVHGVGYRLADDPPVRLVDAA